MDRYLSLFNTRLLALLLVVASLAIAVAAGGVARGEELEPNPPALIPVSAAVLDNTSTYKDSIVHHSRKRGDTISYRIYVFNSGTDAAHNVAVVDPLPPHTSYVPNSLTINFSNQSMATWPGTVFLGTIPYSTSSVRIEYSVLITGDAPVGVITNTATISGDGIDPFTRSDSTNVSAKADLDNWDTYKYLTTQRAYAPLESLEYNIRVRNSGNDTARNVRIVEKLPPNTTYLPNTLKIDNFVSPQGTGALPAAILLGRHRAKQREEREVAGADRQRCAPR